MQALPEPRKYVLAKGSKITGISYRNSIEHPTQHFYFTSSAEALLSLFRDAQSPFRELSVDQNKLIKTNIYLNVFMLTKNLIIFQREDNALQNIINGSVDLTTVQNAIKQDCSSFINQQDGYVVQYLANVGVNPWTYDRREKIVGRLSSYVICQPDVLLHVGSFSIDPFKLVSSVADLVLRWRESLNLPLPNSNVSSNSQSSITVVTNNRYQITFAVLLAELTELVKSQQANFLTAVFIQPQVAGYTTSPVKANSLLVESPRTPPSIFTSNSVLASPRTPPNNFSPLASPRTPVKRNVFSVDSSPDSGPPPLEPFSTISLGQTSPEFERPAIFSPGGTTPIDPFQAVPKDLIRVMALNMNLADILAFCRTSKLFTQEVCNSEAFWYRKSSQDFPKHVKAEGSWKDFYQQLMTQIDIQLGYYAQGLNHEQLKELINLAPELRQARATEMRQAAGLGPVRALNFDRMGGLNDNNRDVDIFVYNEPQIRNPYVYGGAYVNQNDNENDAVYDQIPALLRRNAEPRFVPFRAPDFDPRDQGYIVMNPNNLAMAGPGLPGFDQQPLPIIQAEPFVNLADQNLPAPQEAQPYLEGNYQVYQELTPEFAWRELDGIIVSGQMSRQNSAIADNEIFGLVQQRADYFGRTPQEELELYINIVNRHPHVGILRNNEEDIIRRRLENYLRGGYF